MITRSKIKNNKKDSDSDSDTEIINDNENNDNENIEDDIDEYGNIKNLIDYDCNEPFDRSELDKELLKLKKITNKSIDKKNKSIDKKNKSIDKKNKKIEINSNIKIEDDIFNLNNIKKRKFTLDNIENSDTDSDYNNLVNTPRSSSSDISNFSEELNDDLKILSENNDEIFVEKDALNLLENKLKEIIENSINKSNIEEDDLEYEKELCYLNQDSNTKKILDDLDKEYMEKIKKNENNEPNIDDFEYFIKLNEYEKKKIIDDMNEIDKINNLKIPLKFKILQSNMDINTKSKAITHINKIKNMDPSSGEFIKMDQWINGLIKIPFSKYITLPINNNSNSKKKKDFLKNTYEKLNKAIYGHAEAKSHILQIIGKWIKNPISQGNILALQGPMGNGKTTLVKAGIAKAINRPFAFIALGGASDSSFFDGHNYTYEGSHWGRIIDILIESKCMNPIFYFDELDKVSDTYKGQEIIHLLTHLTDHSQNDKFQDNYFSGINLDLSKALFIFSFNDEKLIDPILKDRMYVIKTKGFNVDDKIEITKKYLLPQLYDTFKYNNNIIISNEIIKEIINNFTNKEKGVRNLKRCLESIISKINMYEILYNSDTSKPDIILPYKLSNFKMPYNVKIEDLKELLKKDEIYSAPEHMYV
jgi:ATP-dependent Lon protease